MNIVEQELNFFVIPLCSKCCKDNILQDFLGDEEDLASVSPLGSFHS